MRSAALLVVPTLTIALLDVSIAAAFPSDFDLVTKPSTKATI